MNDKNKFEKWLSSHPKTASLFALLLVAIFVLVAGLMSSCNVTRTVTTKAEYYQKGDTTIQIVTRTTESYDGKVDATKFLNK